MTRYLLLTNVVSGVVVDASGDFIVQKMIERTSAYDYPRTSRMAIVGMSLTIPDHYWYKLLDKRFPGRCAKTITLKVILDCVIMGPVNIALFYLGEGLYVQNIKLLTCVSYKLTSSGHFMLVQATVVTTFS